jgi:hypothetical protein
LHIDLGGHFTKNTYFDPSGHMKNGKCIFMWKLKNTSYKSCWECKDAHLHQKWDQGSIVCCGTCTNHGHLAKKTKRTPAWKHLFVKEFTCELWHAMFGIIPR